MNSIPQDAISPPQAHPPLLVVRPAASRTLPIVVTSPHSGTDYTADLLAQSRLPLPRLRASEDSLVNDLIERAPQFGATLLAARVPRVFCDLNRGPWELDPDMFIETLPAYCDVASPRIAQGYGTVARFAAAGDAIYAHRLSFAEAQRRVATFWQPFHATLAATIDELRARFGTCLLLDCHSMPTSRADEPDAVLGDGFGTSCAPEWLRLAEAAIQEAGLRSVRNHPYAGGYITRHYGRPLQGVHALQIEIARPLYLQRGTHLPGRGFARIRLLLETIVQRAGEALASE